MLKAALEYITNLREPKIEEINGDFYSDKPLHRIDTYFPKASTPITVSTLTSFVRYITERIDEHYGEMIVHVESPTVIKLMSKLDDNREREYVATAIAMLPELRFGTYTDQESFCIGLQSKFISNEDRELLLKFAGTVQKGTIAEYGDDGVTQKATIKTGIASTSDAIVPNPVTLKPYRTFLEVEQPESKFIFRMKDLNGVQCALFEADGGAWKIEAMQRIKEYLQEALEEVKDQFIVIA